MSSQMKNIMAWKRHLSITNNSTDNTSPMTTKSVIKHKSDNSVHITDSDEEEDDCGLNSSVSSTTAMKTRRRMGLCAKRMRTSDSPKKTKPLDQRMRLLESRFIGSANRPIDQLNQSVIVVKSEPKEIEDEVIEVMDTTDTNTNTNTSMVVISDDDSVSHVSDVIKDVSIDDKKDDSKEISYWTPTKPKTSTKTVDSKISCLLCPKNFETIDSLKQHYISHLDVGLICGNCRQKFDSLVKYRKHDCQLMENNKLQNLDEFKSAKKWCEQYGESDDRQLREYIEPNVHSYCPVCRSIKGVHQKRIQKLLTYKMSKTDKQSTDDHYQQSQRNHLHQHLIYFPYQCIDCQFDDKITEFCLNKSAQQHLKDVHNITNAMQLNSNEMLKYFELKKPIKQLGSMIDYCLDMTNRQFSFNTKWSHKESKLAVFKKVIWISCLQLPRLPTDHIKYWLRNNRLEYKSVKKLCADRNFASMTIESLQSNNITDLNADRDLSLKQNICSTVLDNELGTDCWGYESDCQSKHMYSTPECPDDSAGWAPNQLEAMKMFFVSADFGYVAQRLQELKYFCQPKQLVGISSRNNKPLVSSLKCTQYTRYCLATNIMIDFEMLTKLQEPVRYREDVIGGHHIGGWNCDLKDEELRSESHHKSPLQSWFAEIENYKILRDDLKCDIWIDKPTFIMKLDATVNMYHHFCDFINLYASLHMNNSFSLDNNIIIWDSYPYRSNFGIVWQAFTRNPVLYIGQFKGKKVCFRDLMMPLLPRMIYGIYYNMPLIPGCHKSGLFRAFNRHLIERLNIKVVVPENDNLVRITLISRRTKYRQILNEQELIDSLSDLKDVSIKLYDFNHWMQFSEQIEISANSDVLIGMHGAGLTHVLFQPDWSVLFELFNCDDEHCYKDLARLRGAHYMTWTDRSKIYPEKSDYKSENPKFSADAKFTNYRFDANEFRRLVLIAVNYVRNNRIKILYDNTSDKQITIDLKTKSEL
ncbi:uncharacterized protein LOC128959425 [Oppia nitens]|uniref:uncharacterized protein LOC128959425 n=1 Tax=Oppia nitens TaxID=1686743 RepID=UPI0023D9B334|nr:uncharacterized protein LOC128959425 [Oppia nitens]